MYALLPQHMGIGLMFALDLSALTNQAEHR